jgi:hypothetical protein
MMNTSCTHNCIKILKNIKYNRIIILLYDTMNYRVSIICMILVYNTSHCDWSKQYYACHISKSLMWHIN